VLSESGPVPGVIGARRVRRKPGEDPKPLGIEDVFLDIGAREGDEARGRVSVGDAAVWEGAPLALLGSRLASRSLDNRLGCYVALEVARRVAAEGGAPADVIGMAVVQEEVGDFPGARTATYTVRPDIAVAVDVTHATDVRGGDPEEEGEVKLGSGAALTRGTSLHPAIYRLLRETADAEGIPFSVEVARGHTHTDADAVHLSRHGIATGLVSFPLRYMHSPVELVDLDDVEAVVRLLVAFAQRLEPGLSLAR
jgi:putative aminopeptidase FrvX